MNTFECQDSEQKQQMICPLLMYMVPESLYCQLKNEGKLPRISLHGSLIIQELLHFQKPIKVRIQ